MLVLPVIVLLLVSALALAAVHIQAAVRAYEISTNQIATARAQAVTALMRYARSHNEADWIRYQEGMRMPDSAREIREVLRDKGPQGLPQVKQIMIQTGRHPDDVDAMLRLYRWFGRRFISSTTRDAWRQTDQAMRALTAEAQSIRAIAQRSPQHALSQTEQHLQRIDELESTMEAASTRLSENWAQASRTTSRMLLIGITVFASILTLGSAFLMRRALRQQHHYTRSLSEAQRRWELASSAAGLGLYQVTTQTGAIQLDGAAAAMHGLGRQAMSLDRQALSALIHEQDRPATELAIDDALEQNHDYRITYRVHHPGGDTRTLEACGRYIPADSRGNDARLIGVIRDVTDATTQAEQALQREAAERVTRAQRAFLSRLSHELRTPLNAILGFAQLLDIDERHPLPATQRQQVQWILSAGQQLLALIEDVLDMSKVEAGEISLHLEQVDVNALIHECVPMLETVRQQHQVTIVNRCATTPLLAKADAQRLRQIIINLLSNACKYNRREGHARIGAHQEGDAVVLDVSDDGIGMRPEEAEQLFQPFRRLPSAISHAEGTGLGLYIVKQLVERMHGSVSVWSDPGVGTRFTVRLPAASADTH